MQKILVQMEAIDKAFPGVKALNQARFELCAGEVHALMGENGAGKSTLMKVLTGNYTKDSGTIWISGKEVDIKNPKQATALGISMIHQELSLIPHLTLAQNIFLGRESKAGLGFLVDEKRINTATQEIFESMNLDLDPKVKAQTLSVARQQMAEIAKAVSFNSEIIIMDEPTAALTETEMEELFKVIGRFKRRGAGIIYISHRMEELERICDRVTVMRDGCYIATSKVQEISRQDLIRQMVGRTIYESTGSKEHASTEAPVVLEVCNLTRKNAFKDISFTLKKGEILGFAGLMGAGRTEVARAIFGADPVDSGTLHISGRQTAIRSPRDAVAAGIGYLSEDRKKFGLVLGLSVEENSVLSSMKDFLKGRFVVNRYRISEKAEFYVKELRIKTPGIRQKAVNLSGGNQQKVVIAKWLLRNCDILIFDEPTRGIDVGAKNEIYKLLGTLSEQGKSIIMISSELPEVIRMSHRVLVMCEGRITGQLAGEEITQEGIMTYAHKTAGGQTAEGGVCIGEGNVY